MKPGMTKNKVVEEFCGASSLVRYLLWGSHHQKFMVLEGDVNKWSWCKLSEGLSCSDPHKTLDHCHRVLFSIIYIRFLHTAYSFEIRKFSQMSGIFIVAGYCFTEILFLSVLGRR